MSSRLWFYLDDVLALADHASAASTFDTGYDNAVDEPALTLVGGDGIRLRSNGLPTLIHTNALKAVYAQGAPAGAGGERRLAAGRAAREEIALCLPLHPNDHDGLLRGMRRAAADGDRWLVIAIDDGDTGVTLYPTRTLEAVTHHNARWIPATVRVYGVLGPYQAQIADGYRWLGWMVPRFTTPVVEAIIADIAALAAGRAPGEVETVRWRANTVEVVTAAGTATERTAVVHPDAAGMFAVGACAWCWEIVEPAQPHQRAGAAEGSDVACAASAGCLCPRRCLLCGEPVNTHHDLDCAWQHGSTEGESPRLARQPLVLDAHVHRPSCRHARPHPGGLFHQISAEGDVRCSLCGAINTDEGDSFPSFGATTEHHRRCTACGAQWSFCDLSAIR